jgi:hypothetical protein
VWVAQSEVQWAERSVVWVAQSEVQWVAWVAWVVEREPERVLALLKGH